MIETLPTSNDQEKKPPYSSEVMGIVYSAERHEDLLSEDELARVTQANRTKFKELALLAAQEIGVAEVKEMNEPVSLGDVDPLAVHENDDGTNRTELVAMIFAGVKPYGVVRHRARPEDGWLVTVTDGGSAGFKPNGEPYIAGFQVVGSDGAVIGRDNNCFKEHNNLESREHFKIKVSEHNSGLIDITNLSKNGTSILQNTTGDRG